MSPPSTVFHQSSLYIILYIPHIELYLKFSTDNSFEMYAVMTVDY